MPSQTSLPTIPFCPVFVSSQVTIGSYPNTAAEAKQKYKVKLQLNGRDLAAVKEAEVAIQEALGPVFKQLSRSRAAALWIRF